MIFYSVQIQLALLQEVYKARKVKRPFQHMNSILDKTESLKDMDAKIKKAKEVKDELEQLDVAVKDLKKRAANKESEMEALRSSTDYLDDEQVSDRRSRLAIFVYLFCIGFSWPCWSRTGKT